MREVGWSVPARAYISEQPALCHIHSFRETLRIPLEMRVVVNEPLSPIHEIYGDAAECVLPQHDYATIYCRDYRRAARGSDVRRAMRTPVGSGSIEGIVDFPRRNADYWYHQWASREVLGIGGSDRRDGSIIAALPRWERRQWYARAHREPDERESFYHRVATRPKQTQSLPPAAGRSDEPARQSLPLSCANGA
jgi:hypothetical protein